MAKHEGDNGTPAKDPRRADVAAVVQKIVANMEKVIIGKRPQITLTLVAYLCEGHILLEDVPGVAKTMLARALARQLAARDGTRYGVRHGDCLVPETVPYEGLTVGRFEVTQAQYAAFDPSVKVEPGRENYPAHGVTLSHQTFVHSGGNRSLQSPTYALDIALRIKSMHSGGQNRRQTAPKKGRYP